MVRASTPRPERPARERECRFAIRTGPPGFGWVRGGELQQGSGQHTIGCSISTNLLRSNLEHVEDVQNLKRRGC